MGWFEMKVGNGNWRDTSAVVVDVAAFGSQVQCSVEEEIFTEAVGRQRRFDVQHSVPNVTIHPKFNSKIQNSSFPILFSPKFSKILQDYLKFSKILQDYQRLSKIIKDYPRLSKILQDSLEIFVHNDAVSGHESQRISKNLKESLRISENLWESWRRGQGESIVGYFKPFQLVGLRAGFKSFV